jgi:hypothetical protein
MANKEHLAILNNGVKIWNRWRFENPYIKPDLSGIKLVDKDVDGANLSRCDLGDSTIIRMGTAINIPLVEANLRSANLSGIHLLHGNLIRAYLLNTNFSEAYLHHASLAGANLQYANLTNASLKDASLVDAQLAESKLEGADFDGLMLKNTSFNNVDLKKVKNLDKCRHCGPCNIDYQTIIISGPLPLPFLRGCGFPDQLIEYLPSLLEQTIQFYTCFISYSSKDQEFAGRLHADLQVKGVRCWFAPEDLKIGDKFRTRIDESIRIHDKLLLILSENSIASDWVEKEVETAFEQERERKTTVLFPIRLDHAAMESKFGWAADIRRTRHIGDFTKWKHHDSYQRAFDQLLRDLKSDDIKKE